MTESVKTKAMPAVNPAASARRTFILENKQGLHARPSALLVKTLLPFECEVLVESGGETVNGRSILGLLSLAAGYRAKLNFTVSGRDAYPALDAIQRLFDSSFSDAY